MKLNARVVEMPFGVTIVICTSPTPISEWEQQPILAKINEEYPVESSRFYKYGVIARAINAAPPKKGRK